LCLQRHDRIGAEIAGGPHHPELLLGRSGGGPLRLPPGRSGGGPAEALATRRGSRVSGRSRPACGLRHRRESRLRRKPGPRLGVLVRKVEGEVVADRLEEPAGNAHLGVIDADLIDN
jgi:hypothetical protein